AEPYHSLVKVRRGSGRVAHPDVRLDVDAAAVFDAHRDEPARDEIVPVVGEGEPRPVLPLPDAALDPHRRRADLEERGAQLRVHPQPGIEGEAVVPRPPGVALHRYERVALLPRRAHRRDERRIAVLTGQAAHRLDEMGPETLALATAVDHGDHRGEDV